MPRRQQKTLSDLGILTGLQQKTDPRKLPQGAAAAAINLVANKRGALEKRLGFEPLALTDPTAGNGGANPLTSGIALGTWNENLLIVGESTGIGGGTTPTQLRTYSDDLDGWVCRGPVPEVKITRDTIAGNTPHCATNVVTVAIDDYLVMAWIDSGANGSLPPYRGGIAWQAIELSTGNVLSAPQPVSNSISTTDATEIRLVAVGTTFVLCHNSNSVVQAIGCVTMTVAQLEAGLGWFPHGDLVSAGNIAGGGYRFDMRAAGGDLTHFLLAWQQFVTVGPGNVPTAIICEQRDASSPGTVVATFTAEATPSTEVQAFGIRADTTTARLVLAYVLAGSTIPTTGNWTIRAASGTYPSMAASKGAATVYTSFTATSGDYEQPPSWLAVTHGGTGGTTSGTRTWTVSHSPWCSVWNALNNTGAGLGTFLAPYPSGAGEPNAIGQGITSLTNFPCMSDARIIQNLIYEGPSTMLGWANASGGAGDSFANALITRGVILTSQGYEANGIAYFTAWVPSYTQGSYILMAHDAAQNPNGAGLIGAQTPMRPCGILQTRTANATPGIGPAGAGGGGGGTPGPNSWQGGSEWAVAGDNYGSAAVGYVAGAQGQRLQQAYGVVQFAATTGYPMAQWGTITGIGGAMACAYAGTNVTEQAYLWVPEGLFVIVNTTGGGSAGPTWTTAEDQVSWIFTLEQFDEQGNFHQSARSTPIVITGAMLVLAGVTLPYTASSPLQFVIPTLGVTMRMWPKSTNGMPYTVGEGPVGSVKICAYRTIVNGDTYLRTVDRFYNGADPLFPDMPANTFATTSIKYSDVITDAELADGTHPELYGDGSTGSPGNLDQFCPPSTSIMVRHKDRLFVSRGNVVQYTKGLSALIGPGYEDQAKIFTVGGSDDIIGLRSMDDKLVILKGSETFYVQGDGPADDGSGQVFASAQPIPTDIGCARPEGIISTPEGVYYQSAAGLRIVSRSLAVGYVGGPVEDEMDPTDGYPNVLSSVLYPQKNRVVFLVTANDTPTAGVISGEVLVRDYDLDVWTSMVLMDGTTQRGFVSAAVATAFGGGTGGPFFNRPGYRKPTLHLLAPDGTVWRERFPEDSQAYFDNATYVSWTWTSSWQTPNGHAQGRFRVWDILTQIESMDPHGLVVSLAEDYGAQEAVATWAWTSPSGLPSIAPNGTTQTPLTELRAYHGGRVEAFQVQIQDVSDPKSVTGQGAKLLGATAWIGTIDGPRNLPGGASQ